MRVLAPNLFVGVLLCTLYVQARTTEQDLYYVAAVVEFSPTTHKNLSPRDSMLENVLDAGQWVANASGQGADIVVFPEMGLESDGSYYVELPDPKQRVSPCNDRTFDQPVRDLSCLARHHQLYLVVNVAEKAECGRPQPCHYNTNVVFDRTGSVVARYRKWNLFGERGTDKTQSVELSTFDTDFGVRFGQIICFDILFETPSITLVRDLNITDVILSTKWMSEVPFLTAVQTQQMWAHRHNVNLLASGFNFPPAGMTGSGIYRGRSGPLASTMAGEIGSSMFVRRVPKFAAWADFHENQGDLGTNPVSDYDAGSGIDPFSEVQGLRMLQDHLETYRTELIPRPAVGKTLSLNQSLCHGELCCHIEVVTRGELVHPMVASSASSLHDSPSRSHTFETAHSRSGGDLDGLHYRLAIFSGVRDHSKVATTGVQVCGVISCLDEKSIQSCGWGATNLGASNTLWTEFVHLKVTGEYNSSGTEQMADTQAGPRYGPLPPSTFTWHVDSVNSSGSGRHQVNLQLTTPVMDLRTFAIYGRVFAWDNMPPTPPGTL